MKITAKIILCVLVFAFSLQSVALAKWQFKPPGEIAKNLGKKAVDKAQQNPDKVEAAAKKMTGNEEEESSKTEKSKEDTKDKKKDQ